MKDKNWWTELQTEGVGICSLTNSEVQVSERHWYPEIMELSLSPGTKTFTLLSLLEFQVMHN